MTFGRTKNVVRRRFRPDGHFHRDRRRSRLDSPLTMTRAGAGALGAVLLFLPRLLVRLVKRR
jgi:hypothetical protein